MQAAFAATGTAWILAACFLGVNKHGRDAHEWHSRHGRRADPSAAWHAWSPPGPPRPPRRAQRRVAGSIGVAGGARAGVQAMAALHGGGLTSLKEAARATYAGVTTGARLTLPQAGAGATTGAGPATMTQPQQDRLRDLMAGSQRITQRAGQTDPRRTHGPAWPARPKPRRRTPSLTQGDAYVALRHALHRLSWLAFLGLFLWAGVVGLPRHGALILSCLLWYVLGYWLLRGVVGIAPPVAAPPWCSPTGSGGDSPGDSRRNHPRRPGPRPDRPARRPHL